MTGVRRGEGVGPSRVRLRINGSGVGDTCIWQEMDACRGRGGPVRRLRRRLCSVERMCEGCPLSPSSSPSSSSAISPPLPPPRPPLPRIPFPTAGQGLPTARHNHPPLSAAACLALRPGRTHSRRPCTSSLDRSSGGSLICISRPVAFCLVSHSFSSVTLLLSILALHDTMISHFPSPILSVAADVVKDLEGEDALCTLWARAYPFSRAYTPSR